MPEFFTAGGPAAVELLELLELHAARSFDDIQLARTRDEHIRSTMRANEAARLLDLLRPAL